MVLLKIHNIDELIKYLLQILGLLKKPFLDEKELKNLLNYFTNVNIPEEKQRRKSMIGQPGVSVTRVSARSGVGGYGGTAPTRINPTGLNI